MEESSSTVAIHCAIFRRASTPSVKNGLPPGQTEIHKTGSREVKDDRENGGLDCEHVHQLCRKKAPFSDSPHHFRQLGGKRPLMVKQGSVSSRFCLPKPTEKNLNLTAVWVGADPPLLVFGEVEGRAVKKGGGGHLHTNPGHPPCKSPPKQYFFVRNSVPGVGGIVWGLNSKNYEVQKM